MTLRELIKYLTKIFKNFKKEVIEEIIKNEDLSSSNLKGIINKLKEKIFVELYTIKDRESLFNVGEPVLKNFSRMDSDLERKIMSELRLGYKYDEKSNDIIKRIAAVNDKAERYAKTWVWTGYGAINEAKRMQDALESGATRFKLIGPEPERQWCQQHYGKTYSIEEIRQMDNGQGLPVEFYRGGYNCKHTWKSEY